MTKTLPLLGVILLIIGAIMYLEGKKLKPAEPSTLPTASVTARTVEEKADHFEPAKEISTPDGFINTNNITIGEFVGKKVVLLDIWTYSCINCQRTLPYLNAWQEKYADKGLVIIGLHTPEFEFEKKYDNVLEAVQKFGITYPVVLDNDYSTWTAYGNRYWPRKYLIDIDGYVVYDHIGEGGYEETERKIQELLHERTERLHLKNGIAEDIATPERAVTVDPTQAVSPETYFGAWRNNSLGNGTPGARGIRKFELPKEIAPNVVYFDGEWDIQEQFAKNTSSGAKIIFRYNAKNVYMVANHENGVTMRVLRDGLPLHGDAGGDVVTKDEVSTVHVNDDRLYHIVGDTEYSEHTLEFIIEDPGLEAFTFTFG